MSQSQNFDTPSRQIDISSFKNANLEVEAREPNDSLLLVVFSDCKVAKVSTDYNLLQLDLAELTET